VKNDDTRALADSCLVVGSYDSVDGKTGGLSEFWIGKAWKFAATA
jgi:hypothetical protein